jgi:hypothetical protein
MKMFTVLALALVLIGGALLAPMDAMAQGAGKKAEQKIQGSKVGQDMRDVQKDAPATFDGAKSSQSGGAKVQPSTSTYSVQQSTATPTVTPQPRNTYVPKQYQSFQSKEVPSPAPAQTQTKTPAKNK